MDPITGEGIYYAFKSAEILCGDHRSRRSSMRSKVGLEIGRELARASRMYKRFYEDDFSAGISRKRTVQLSQRSRTLKNDSRKPDRGQSELLDAEKEIVLFASIDRNRFDYRRDRINETERSALISSIVGWFFFGLDLPAQPGLPPSLCRPHPD